MSERRVGGLPGCGAWAWASRALLHGSRVPGFEPALSKGPLVLVRPSQDDIEDVADAYQALAPVFDGEPAWGAPRPSGSALAARGGVALFGDDPMERVSSLKRLQEGARLVLATGPALAAALPTPAEFERSAVGFSLGARSKRGQAVERLVEAGYRRVEFVESPGEFAVRGAVLDFFAVEPAAAVRVLYDEDTVASLRIFDPVTQITKEQLSWASATMARESSGAVLADWVGAQALWIADEGIEAALPAGTWRGSAAGGPGFGARPAGPFGTDPALAFDEMRRLAGRGFKVLLFSLNRGEDSRMQELAADKLPEGACQFLIGPLRQGFVHDGLGLAVFSTAEIFRRRYRVPSRWSRFGLHPRAPFRLAQLKKGDFVVHRDYGVALYKGLESVETPGHGVTDCLVLEYRGGDTVYVAMTEFDRIQKYSSAEGKRPRLSSLNTRRWSEVKSMVVEGVRELAEELIRLEAKRRARPGFAFGPENLMEREFAEEFPFEATPDQAKAIADVLADLESPHPMDRLVVGDVGFGKTEVAMRAAFRCVANYKQAVVLVPTTILADQHYRTFSQRFADYPVKLAVLTRFQTRAEQRTVAKGLAQGTLDVVIGTVRLLQRDIRFKDLGLIVIDEEHRFGVKDKERLKSMRAHADCLALSATPIPRTLHQAMSGLRGISLIQSAPTGRLPIETRIAPWSAQRAAAAISEELARGGQAYYVHNRVRSLPACLQRLSDLLPGARFCMAHGQMTAGKLEEVMWRFFNREFDVLVASSIIESGLDIPSVNTLLVEDAQDFGLAQIYQLRGRIGRERQKAYCWLFLPEGVAAFKELPEEGRRRLEAIQELSQIGSGIKLAMRDLEIRGAGDLLGKKQHGFLDSVGVEFYTQLLQDEIARVKGGEVPTDAEVTMDFKMDAFLPADYLPGEMERFEFYKRILRSTPQDWPGLRRELADLCGPLPGPVLNLFELLKVRHLAQRARLRSIVQRGRHIEAVFRHDAPVDPAAIAAWLKSYEGKVLFFKTDEGDGLRVELGTSPPLGWVQGFLEGLAKMVP
ncbi:MAG: DEAD/DEAH box helicase [Elusimicrobia bacterium]|nr:DEAD/DEAH box helicase [Elusimicrobiota bacterium]